jgi:hypothetical protein
MNEAETRAEYIDPKPKKLRLYIVALLVYIEAL